VIFDYNSQDSKAEPGYIDGLQVIRFNVKVEGVFYDFARAIAKMKEIDA
jgi:hypothetical protein